MLWRIFVKSSKKLKMKKNTLYIYLKMFKNSGFLVMSFRFDFFCNFLKNTPDYIEYRHIRHFVFYEFFCSSNFFSIVEKLNIYLFLFCNKKIQPPVEPREHHLSEIIQGRSKSKFNITNILFDSSVFLGSGYNLSQLFRNYKRSHFKIP